MGNNRSIVAPVTSWGQTEGLIRSRHEKLLRIEDVVPELFVVTPRSLVGSDDDGGPEWGYVGIGAPTVPVMVDSEDGNFTSLSEDDALAEAFRASSAGPGLDDWERNDGSIDYLSPWDFTSIHPGQCVEFETALSAFRSWFDRGELDPTIRWAED